MEGLPERTVPYNIEAERSVLGAIFIHRDAIISIAPWLKPEDFYREAHSWIYNAQLSCYYRREPPDLITVAAELERQDRLETVGGMAYLSSLVDAVPTAVHVEYYGRIVERNAVLRRLITAGGQIAGVGYEAPESVDDAISRAEELVFAISQRRVTRDFVPVKEVTSDYFDRLSRLRASHSTVIGIPSGFRDLDKFLGGFQRSDLVILAARPSAGKTSLALTIAYNAAVQFGAPVGIFSLEMSREQLVQRFLAMDTGIDSYRLRQGRLTDEEFQQVSESMGSLAEAPIFLDDTPGITATELRSKARRLHAEEGVEMIILDYLQLMQGARAESRVQEISQISRLLKGVARELDVPVLALSQLSRAVEHRTPHIPVLADLRESGCLTGDSQVYLPDKGSYVPIRDLIGQSGFRVTGLNTQTWKLEPATVTNAFSTGVKPVYRLTTWLGHTVRATANHKFLTIRGWKRLDELKEGEHIALPRNLPGPSQRSMSDAELALLGHLIGDGCTLPRHAIQYTTKALDLAELVARLATQVFGESIQPRIQKERTWYQVYLSTAEHLTHNTRNPIAAWLDELGVFGLRSHEKRVPREVFEQSPEGIATFLRHLWATDGCIHFSKGKRHYPKVYYASSSNSLSHEVQSLLLRLGIVARIAQYTQNGKGRDQYHTIISGKKDLERFIHLIGTISAQQLQHLQKIKAYLEIRKANTNRDSIPSDIWRMYAVPAMQQYGITTRQMQTRMSHAYCGTTLYKQNISRERAARLAQAVQSEELALLAESDVYWDRVKSIEAGGSEAVFDLTVDGLHCFVSNDIILHNSIEQDADVVMFIYREEMYDSDTDKQGVAEIHIAKHRNGPIGKAFLYFRKETTRFENLERFLEPEGGYLP